MTVAVLMRTFDEDRRLLAYSIESVLRQTYGDFKLFIYSDGGNSVEWLCENYKDPRVTIWDGKENRGRGYAANYLLENFSDDCEWFTWADSDGDQMGLRYLESVARIVEPLIPKMDFWWARPFCYMGITLEHGQSVARKLLAAQMFSDGKALDSDRVWISKGHVPPGFNAGVDVFYPASARVIRFNERAAFNEDGGWNTMVGQWARSEYDIFYNPKTIGVTIYTNYDALCFYIYEPVRDKYANEKSFYEFEKPVVPVMQRRARCGDKPPWGG